MQAASHASDSDPLVIGEGVVVDPGIGFRRERFEGKQAHGRFSDRGRCAGVFGEERGVEGRLCGASLSDGAYYSRVEDALRLNVRGSSDERRDSCI